MPLLSARIAIIILMLLSIPVASYLPVQAGWENGFVESLQVSVMLSALGLAI